MKYDKTVIQIVVLSEREDNESPYNPQKLSEIEWDIMDGHYSGEWDVVKQTELTPKQMARALMKQGTDTEFFMLDKNGNPIEEAE